MFRKSDIDKNWTAIERPLNGATKMRYHPGRKPNVSQNMNTITVEPPTSQDFGNNLKPEVNKTSIV